MSGPWCSHRAAWYGLVLRAVVVPLLGIAALAVLALMLWLGGGSSWMAALPIAVAVLGGLIIPGWSIAYAWGARGVTPSDAA